MSASFIMNMLRRKLTAMPPWMLPTAGASLGSTAALLAAHPFADHEQDDVSSFTNSTYCESNINANSNNNNNKHTKNRAFQLLEEQKKANLRTRMTAIGKFSLISQTDSNPSQPAFFIALSNANAKATTNVNANNAIGNIKTSTQTPYMSTQEFQKIWFQKEMHIKHPRFHSKVSSCGEFFEPLSTQNDASIPTSASVSTSRNKDLGMHASETLHMHIYRLDLKARIEQLLTNVMDVTEKLWTVQISNGELGSSGAISRSRSKEIIHQLQQQQDQDQLQQQQQHTKNTPMETVMLFRCHHSLGDAVSIVTALGDLLDEAQEIQEKIKQHFHKKRLEIKSYNMLQRLWMKLQKLIWFLFGSIQAIANQGLLILTTPKNPFLAVLNLTQEEEEQLLSSADGEIRRSISWCDVAHLDEVKRIAKAVGGTKTTVNDLFVSCVTAAVAKQLAHNRDQAGTGGCEPDLNNLQTNINVVIPAHLAGGILPPGRGIGNLIGAFVARVPGEMGMGGSNQSSSPSERLKQVHSSLDIVKRSPAPIIGYLMAKLSSNYLPESLATTLFRRSSANAAVAISNSRGYEKKVHINGRAVESITGFYPLPPGLPVGVLIQSYGNVVSLSVTAEKWAVPDADQFLAWVLDEYKLLCIEAEATSALLNVQQKQQQQQQDK